MSELRLLPILLSFCGIYVFKSLPAQAHTLHAGSLEFHSTGHSKAGPDKTITLDPNAPQTLELQTEITFRGIEPEVATCTSQFHSTPALDHKIRAGLSPPTTA